MSSKRHVPKFRRAAPAVRREALIEATLRCLKRHGHDGASVRRISAEAGVSIGLINHHFPSKSGLVAEAYDTLASSLRESLRAQAQNDGVSPRVRLSLFFHASFAPELLDPELFNVWVVFWGMVAHASEIRSVHDRTYGQYRLLLENLLGQLTTAGLAPRLKLRAAAIALSALLDGLWVELSLSSETFKPGEAIAICEDWVDALCSGAFPRLHRTAGGRVAAVRPLAGRASAAAQAKIARKRRGV
jgi:TetR/AcrR family transcriptional regulator, transcriptional repressor of bet genes